MGVTNYHIKETDFDQVVSEKHELSILLGVGSFTYVLREKSNHQVVAFRSQSMLSDSPEDWVQSLEKTIQNDTLLRSGELKTVYLSFLTDRATLVPSRFFENGKEADYLSHLTPIGLSDRCRSEAVPVLGTHLVYAIGEDKVAITAQRFAPVLSRHLASGLLAHWVARSVRLGQRAVFCCIRDQQLIVCVLDRAKPLFFNVFKFGSPQDALYFVALAYQQVGWSTSRIPLYLCGDILPTSEVYRQFYRFIEDIRFLNYDGPFEVGPQLSALPAHLYYDLLCQF
ncbi:MAG: DUF3822 family protein [Bacteroidota bacterium]